MVNYKKSQKIVMGVASLLASCSLMYGNSKTLDNVVNHYKLPVDKSSYHSEELSIENQFKGDISNFNDLYVISKDKKKILFFNMYDKDAIPVSELNHEDLSGKLEKTLYKNVSYSEIEYEKAEYEKRDKKMSLYIPRYTSLIAPGKKEPFKNTLYEKKIVGENKLYNYLNSDLDKLEELVGNKVQVSLGKDIFKTESIQSIGTWYRQYDEEQKRLEYQKDSSSGNKFNPDVDSVISLGKEELIKENPVNVPENNSNVEDNDIFIWDIGEEDVGGAIGN